MKTIRIKIDQWLDKQDEIWRNLPLVEQRKYTLYFFLGYLLLTAGVIVKVGYDTAQSNNRMVIVPIDSSIAKKESPASQFDTVPTIKKKIYERK